MEDDDEFGDLYTDVLRPFTASLQSEQPPPVAHSLGGGGGAAAEASKATETSAFQTPRIDPKVDEDDRGIIFGAQKSNCDPNLSSGSSVNVQEKTLATQPEEKQPRPNSSDFNLSLNPQSGQSGGSIGVGVGANESDLGARVFEKSDVKSRDWAFGDSTFTDEANIDVVVEERDDKDDDLVQKDENIDKPMGRSENCGSSVVEAGGSEHMIPGLSIPGVSGVPETCGDKALDDEWDSDSDDDDLRIVLNDNNHGPMGMDRMGGDGDDDDDDGDRLVIVANSDDPSHQPMAEEQEWGEELGNSADGERKEDAAKVNVGPGYAPKIGYSNHGYHHPYHSQFKYVRPGAAPIPGAPPVGPGGTPGQVHPPVNTSLVAGRGRGDWRPPGMKGALTMQKGFPGYSAWGSNPSGRGIGLDFTLPSHKTIFEVDIDSFEEKPWRLQGIDMSDFFNFGLNEESWKDYCKQLEQLRLESTMQGKIRVYESGRTEQEYDPDLPPELAAAAGIQDIPSENANLGKTEAGQNDLARGSMRSRPPLPSGRPIQVESGSGDRLPSIDTRPPRVRDSDAIIEIVCQGSADDDNNLEQGNQPSREGIRGGDEIGVLQQEDTHVDGFQHAYNGWKREFGSRRADFNSGPYDKSRSDRVVILPSEEPDSYHPDSRGQTSVYPGRKHAVAHDSNREKGRARCRSSDIGASESPKDKQIDADNQREDSLSVGDRRSPLSSSPVSNRSVQESGVENNDNLHDELVPAQKNSGMERGKISVDERTNCEKMKDDSVINTAKKHKLSSQLEEPSPQETDGGEDSKAARSSENSKTRSGSSKDYHKLHDGLEEEVQDERFAHVDDTRQTGGEEDRLRRKGRDEKETEKHRMIVKGREDSYLRKGYDSSSAHHSHTKTSIADRRKERDYSDVAWQHRDDDLHGRRSKVEDSRKREHGDEIESKHRNKIRDIDRSEREGRHPLRKQLDNGSLRPDHDKDAGSRHRERDDLKNRYDNIDDRHSKRRKEDTKLSREHVDREETLHSRGDGTLRRKRERDDISDQRKRDDQRLRDDDQHYARYKDEPLFQSERGERHRERDEWYRPKQSHDEILSKRDRDEGRGGLRVGRAAEEKSWAGLSRGKDEYKGSDREYHSKDAGRHVEHLKRRERDENGSPSRHRSREDGYGRGHQPSTDERRARNERVSTRQDHAAYESDSSKVHEKKRKENSTRDKVPEAGDKNSFLPSNLNEDDRSGNASETVSLKRKIEKGSDENVRQSSKKHREDASDDDEQPDSRRGRSKLERWTSHKERDFSVNMKSSTSLKIKENDAYNSTGPSSDRQHPNEHSKKVEDNQQLQQNDKTSVPEINNVDVKRMEDKHLETVEKLKKRSERFKLPMPGEKEATTTKKMENETFPSGQAEARPDSEVKPERPPRRRRWTSS
ncbi:FIP1[V]-like protein isoform X1 [Ipomoea triloba]|uniref:FIP1[V]-like protein isoform X1 n=1 Tax=Ipomoea triloba TaxID=35885 RepID=UPI00125DD687|nr:FIP1[V]-like protein isoform X1 [Ipomoea triloba]